MNRTQLTSAIILIALLLPGCSGKKDVVIDKEKVRKIFTSRVYVLIELEKPNNSYHEQLKMFNDDDGSFFPIYTSEEKVGEVKVKLPEALPFDGIIFAYRMHPSMLYKINYTLPDEIQITGKEVKEILATEIKKFETENAEVLKDLKL